MRERNKETTRLNEIKEKNHIRDILKNVWKEPELANDPSFVGKMSAVHGKMCNCPLCRNPRNNKALKPKERLTMKERRYSLNDSLEICD